MSEQNVSDPYVLFVGNLPYSYVDSDLYKLFANYGKIISAVIIRDERQRSRGFGFVRFATLEAAALALAKLNCSQLENRKLRLNFARKDSRYLVLLNHHQNSHWESQ